MQERGIILMSFLRKFDRVISNLAHSQAMIFERSIEEGIPSRIFIKSFMLSTEARRLDELSLEMAGLSEIEIFDSIKKRTRTKNGVFLSYPIMHFIGYFYRSAVYLSGYSSKQIYEKIPVDFLIRNYDVLHSFAIEEAVRESFEILKIEKYDLYKRFKEIYSRED